MYIDHGSSLKVRRSLWKDWLPILGSVVCMMTILLVYCLTRHADHLPPGARTPPISLLGCKAPEHRVYQCGFFLTGVILLGSIQQWRHVFLPQLNTFGSKTATMAMVGGYLAVLGVTGQGVVTLEHDILERLKLGLGLSLQSIIHQQLAGVFFLGAATHCYATAYYIWSTAFSTSIHSDDQPEKIHATKLDRPNPTSTQQEGKIGEAYSPPRPSYICCYGPWSTRLKLLCVVTSLFSWPIAEGLHPTRTSHIDKRNLNIAGLAQYIAVASYTIFFGSYTLDFVAVRTTQRKHDSSKLS